MKSLLKKILIVVVILSLTISLLSACAEDDKDSPDTTDGATVGTDPEAVTTEKQTEKVETTKGEGTTEPLTEATTEDPFAGAASPLLAEIARKIAQSENYLIFTIGDSVTEGQGATELQPGTPDPNKSYTAMFAKKLGEKFGNKSVDRFDGEPYGETGADRTIVYPNNPVSVQIGLGTGKITVARCGVGGDTTNKLLARKSDFIGKELNGQTGNLFIICIGINDSWPGGIQRPTYKNRLNTLIDSIKESHPDADIILMTPTYVTDNGNVLTGYAVAVKEVAEDRGVACIDLHQMFLDHKVEGAPFGGQGDWLSDNCHPSDIGHEAIADEMMRYLFGEN